MLKVVHRVNTIEHLQQIPSEYGIELDLRDRGGEIVLHHEPFCEGELFRDFLKEYHHQLIILNVKTEGIEEKVLQLLSEYHIDKYFFLDLTIPFAIKYLRKGEHNIAVRFSEYEPLEFVLKFKGMAKWVWVDCFTGLHLNEQSYKLLKDNGFKLCLVSPELEGHPLSQVDRFKAAVKGMEIDAVCTKRPELWE